MKLKRLAVALALSMLAGAITGCATTSTVQGNATSDKPVSARTEKKKPVQKAAVKTAGKPAVAKKVVRKPIAKAETSATSLAAATDTPPIDDKGGISWWLVALPLAVISAGIYGVRKRKGKPIGSFRAVGRPPGPAPPGRSPT